MKRVMMTSVVAGLLGTFGLAPAVSAEGLYGSLRTGVTMTNPDGDGDTTWELGNIENSLGSRIGVKASHELDGGMTAGLHVEKQIGTWGTRLQNVYISGGVGTLTLGQQWTTIYNRTTIDGAYFLGGSTDPIFRANGIKFASSLGGPFNFDVMIRDNSADGEGEGVDIVELGGTLGVGGVAVNVGYLEQDDDAAGGGLEMLGATVGGSFGGLGWKIGASSRELQDTSEVERFALFASYSLMEGGTAYVEYEDQTTDAADGTESDNNWLLVGYSQSLGAGATAIAEYRTADMGNDVAAIALKIDF